MSNGENDQIPEEGWALQRPIFGELKLTPQGAFGQVSDQAEDSTFAPQALLLEDPPSPVKGTAGMPVASREPVASPTVPEGPWVELKDMTGGLSVSFRAVAVTVEESERSVGLVLPEGVVDIKPLVEQVYRLSTGGKSMAVVYVGGRVRLSGTIILPFLLPDEDSGVPL